jgi:transketolase
MRKQFTKTIQSILYQDINTVLLLGDIGVYGFRNEIQNLPDRVYNIGILEQSTVSLAAGLAKEGITPFIHTIAPFIVERAYEQLKIDFGYQQLNGNFISVGGSYDYSALGCTHHCPADVGVLSYIPGMEILVPGTSKELDILLQQTYKNNSPTYIRLSETENNESNIVNYGKGNIIRIGELATVICFGPILQNVIDATKDLNVTVLYYTTVLPFDTALLSNFYNKNIILCEPFYSGTTNYLITQTFKNKQYCLTNIGVSREFLYGYGTKQEQDAYLNLTSEDIRNKIISCIQ